MTLELQQTPLLSTSLVAKQPPKRTMWDSRAPTKRYWASIFIHSRLLSPDHITCHAKKKKFELRDRRSAMMKLIMHHTTIIDPCHRSEASWQLCLNYIVIWYFKASNQVEGPGNVWGHISNMDMIMCHTMYPMWWIPELWLAGTCHFRASDILHRIHLRFSVYLIVPS